MSIGLQSSQDEELEIVGRIHTYNEFLETYNLAKEIGFGNISIDIMLGLPSQTQFSLEKTIDRIIELKPKHISVYSLILEEGTRLFNKANSYTFPNENIERQMYWDTKNKLEEAGYTHYEISNYAIKGYESKHNLDCWNQKEYIGFGLAAHSYLNDKRYSNTTNLHEYVGEHTQIIHEVQTKEVQMKEYMLLGLRKIGGIKVSEFKDKFAKDPMNLYRGELEGLEEKKLIKLEKGMIRLTNKGINFANQVWTKFT